MKHLALFAVAITLLQVAHGQFMALLYEDKSLKGAEKLVTNEEYGVCHTLDQTWGNSVSSIDIGYWCALIYDAPECTGKNTTIYGGTPELEDLATIDFNDAVRSIKEAGCS